MKALISGFALLTFVAATTLPLESYAQTSTGGATTMAPDTGTVPTSTTKKSKKSSKSVSTSAHLLVIVGQGALVRLEGPRPFKCDKAQCASPQSDESLGVTIQTVLAASLFESPRH